MHEITVLKFDLSKEWMPLKEEIFNKKDKSNLKEPISNAIKALNEAAKELQDLVEYVYEQDKNNREIKKLYESLSGKNATILIDNLKRLGQKLQGELGKAFQNVGYRIMELTRAGKRSDVYHLILRIFYSSEKIFPQELSEIFKPIYSEEMFKIFIFSFLSGVLGKTYQNEE